MRTKTFLTIILLAVSVLASQGQEMEDIDKLIESGNFLFIADRAFPTGGSSIDLMNRPNEVEFNGDNAKGHLAFFGRSHSGSTAYSPDGGGIKFDGEMMNKQVKQKKKNTMLTFTIKGSRDQYSCYLTITPSGSATLSVSSNNLSSISYNGAVTPVEKEE